MPSRALDAELQARADSDPEIRRLARLRLQRAGASVPLMNGAFEIAAVPVPSLPPVVFMGGLPGSRQRSVCTRENLVADLDALVVFGIRHVVCLVPEEYLALPSFAPAYLTEAALRFPNRFYHLQLVENEVPRDDTEFEAALAFAEEAVASGDKVYVHCQAGCGRAGLFASCLLVRHGVSALDAVAQVGAARGCGLETGQQVAYVVRYAERLLSRFSDDR